MNEKHLSIINDYKNGMKIGELAKKYNYKYATAISAILKENGIEPQNKRWTKEEKEYIINNYATTEWEEILKTLNRHDKDSIIHMAYKLKIQREFYNYEEIEIQILKEYYDKITVTELQKMLPNRSKESIMVKANKLGLVSREKWEEDEIKRFIDVYPNNNNKDLIEKYFPNRTHVALMSMATILGISKQYSKKEYDEEYLIIKLKELANKLGRTPFYFDLSNNPDYPCLATYYRYFGSYRNACLCADLEINNSSFSLTYAYLSKNNDICFSRGELLITNALINSNIKYSKEKYYKDILSDNRCGNKRCDWYLDDYDIVMEYFGLAGRPFYDCKMEEKINICNENNLKLLSIYEKDLDKIDNIIRLIQ